jgi:hypothetical protein
LADIPISGSDWEIRFELSRMIVAMTVAGLCISLTTDAHFTARHVLSQLYIGSFLP